MLQIIIGAALLESLEVEVFNRWGQRVASSIFNAQSLASEIPTSAGMTELVIWDRTTTAGKTASSDTYFYVVTYSNKEGETVSEKGSVSLLR